MSHPSSCSYIYVYPWPFYLVCPTQSISASGRSTALSPPVGLSCTLLLVKPLLPPLAPPLYGAHTITCFTGLPFDRPPPSDLFLPSINALNASPPGVRKQELHSYRAVVANLPCAVRVAHPFVLLSIAFPVDGYPPAPFTSPSTPWLCYYHQRSNPVHPSLPPPS